MADPIEIKDPVHAVRVLEALVEQGEKTQKIVPNDTVLKMIVEGAKAVLESNKKWAETLSKAKTLPGYRTDGGIHPTDDGINYGRDTLTVALAQAYASRMAEAGMTVPE